MAAARNPQCATAILRTGDVVFIIAQPKPEQGQAFRPGSQYGLVSSSQSLASSPRSRTADLVFSPASDYGKNLQPFILRAAPDGVGAETHAVQYLPSGIPIGSHLSLFLEAVGSSGEYPLMLVPRPTELGDFFRAWGPVSQPALVASRASAKPSRAMALKIDARWLVSGEPVALLSRFGQLALESRGRPDGRLTLLAGVADSAHSFVFRKYAPSYVLADEGCRLLDATTTALTPIRCGRAPPFDSPCRLSTGEYLFWQLRDCEAAQKDSPHEQRQRKAS
jgi:hypothetical protein